MGKNAASADQEGVFCIIFSICIVSLLDYFKIKLLNKLFQFMNIKHFSPTKKTAYEKWRK